MSSIPVLHYQTSNVPTDQAFEEWRELMAPLFHIEHASYAASLPRGSTSSYLLGSIIANRTAFNTQRISREAKRIAATPDHLLLQYYRAGGFHGTLDRHSVTIRPGQVAVCDLAQPIDVRATNSDTIGLAIPKHLLAGLDVARFVPRLPLARERFLAALMEALYQDLSHLSADEVNATIADLLTSLARLFDPSTAADVLEGAELRTALVALAERTIRAQLGSADLTPSWIAERLGVSRATLYRAFAPLGGIARWVQDMRLDAVREALANPLETRSIARLGLAHGFATPAHLSRSFRERFGLSPRELRRAPARNEDDRPHSPDAVQLWWSRLGDRN